MVLKVMGESLEITPERLMLLPRVTPFEVYAVKRFVAKAEQQHGFQFCRDQWAMLEYGQPFFFANYEAMAKAIDAQPRRQREMSILFLYSLNCTFLDYIDAEACTHLQMGKLVGSDYFGRAAAGEAEERLMLFVSQLRRENNMLYRVVMEETFLSCRQKGDGKRLFVALYLLIDRQKELYIRQMKVLVQN
jgi:MFS superfamily sulfate permease-like transporter